MVHRRHKHQTFAIVGIRTPLKVKYEYSLMLDLDLLYFKTNQNVSAEYKWCRAVAPEPEPVQGQGAEEETRLVVGGRDANVRYFTPRFRQKTTSRQQGRAETGNEKDQEGEGDGAGVVEGGEEAVLGRSVAGHSGERSKKTFHSVWTSH